MITRNTDYSIQRLRGLSTDTKPVNVPNGSEFREMDTGKDFMYDEASGEWKEQPKKGGGGGGGEPLIIEMVAVEETHELSVTYKEIKDAMMEGKNVYLFYTTTYDDVETQILDPVAYLSEENNQDYSVFFRTTPNFRADSETGKLVQ